MKFPLLASAMVLAACAAHAADAPIVMTAPSAKQLSSLCSDCSIVASVATEKRKGKASGLGVAGGAVAGGVVGHKVGDSTVATVGGAVVGGVVGNELEKRLKRHTVWVVTLTARDGSSSKREFDQDPQLKAGDVVSPDGKGLKRR
jgi:outer membrane lipoprotein SlyB